MILAQDLAQIYGVETRVLNQAVKRNANRFPGDFMFQLTAAEAADLKSQPVISSWGGARRALPSAFTEHGAVMVASILNSPKAVQMSVYVVRAFVSFARSVTEHKELAAKISVLEGKVGKHDKQLQHLLKAIRLLIAPPRSRSAQNKRFRKIIDNTAFASQLSCFQHFTATSLSDFQISNFRFLLFSSFSLHPFAFPLIPSPISQLLASIS